MTDDPLLAHSIAEAKLFLLANACPTCSAGPVRTRSYSESQVGGPRSELTFSACCDACGHQFDRRFAMDPVSVSESSSVINPTHEPSQILDLAQWLTLATMLTESARQEPDKIGARQLRIEAGMCLEEALKFHTDSTNDLPPPEAFFTDATRASFRKHPERFARPRLLTMRLDLPTPRGA